MLEKTGQQSASHLAEQPVSNAQRSQVQLCMLLNILHSGSWMAFIQMLLLEILSGDQRETLKECGVKTTVCSLKRTGWRQLNGVH